MSYKTKTTDFEFEGLDISATVDVRVTIHSNYTVSPPEHEVLDVRLHDDEGSISILSLLSDFQIDMIVEEFAEAETPEEPTLLEVL